MNNTEKVDFGTTCCCIARVSTSQQDYDAQTNALHAKAASLGLTVIKDIETKESGFRSLDKKEGFNELVEFMKANNCRIVICTELSRLSRKKFLLEQIKQWFIENRIQLIVIDINFTLFNNLGGVDMTADIVFSVHASIAESEMQTKAKRLKRGRDELVKAGYSLGGKTTFGYTRKKNAVKVKGKERSIMEINEQEADQIRTIYDWYLNGIGGDVSRCSITQIQKECIARGFAKYLHSKRNVNKALKNELYTGHVITHNIQKNPEFWNYGDNNAPKYLKSSSEITVPQIISRGLFDAVQAKMSGATTRQYDKSTKHFTLLSKLIRCPKCGSYYLGEYRKRKDGLFQYYYRCQNHKSHGASELSMKYLDYAIWTFCKLHFTKFSEYIRSFPELHSSEVIKQRIENIKGRKDTLVEEQKKLTDRFLLVQKMTGMGTETFIKEAERLKKMINECDNAINDEEMKLSEVLQVEAMQQVRAKTISFVESSKHRMRVYIYQVVKEIVPVYSDSIYTVLRVDLKNDVMGIYNCEIPDEENNGLPRNRYIIINKRDNHRPQIRYIAAHCWFDENERLFHLSTVVTGTLENVFNDIEEEYFKEMSFKPLSIYQDDKPNAGFLLDNSVQSKIQKSIKQNSDVSSDTTTLVAKKDI